MENKTITLYGCGGCGINVVKHIMETCEPSSKFFASLNPVYIDTSHSNVDGVSENTYIIPARNGEEGSGKVRKENAGSITERALQMLEKFQPGDLSIVISSASGGSGSVISPTIVSELLNRSLPVIVFIVGSHASLIERDNTVKTLKSFASVSAIRNVPLIVSYYGNDQDGSRDDIDGMIKEDVVKLSLLFSGCNKELDTRDLTNWLYYNRTTNYAPRVSIFSINNGPLKDVDHNLISAATLAGKGMTTHIGEEVDYQCVGYLDSSLIEKFGLTEPVHFVVHEGLFEKIGASLIEKHAELQTKVKSRVATVNIVGDNDIDQAAPNGLIL